MKKSWLLPTIVLALLLFAWIFRWDYTATKSQDLYVLKWKTDRWTGQKWQEIYGPKISNVYIIDSGFLPINNKTMITIWFLGVGISSIFLYRSIKSFRQGPKDKDPCFYK